LHDLKAKQHHTMTEDEVKRFFANDKFALENGIVIESVEQGRAVGYMDVSERHLNAGGACQGGAIFTLADTLIAVAANSTEIGCVSVQASIAFSAAGRLGTRLTCRAVVTAPHRKMPTISATVTDNEGRVIATATSVCYNKDADKR
jgi:acyl-CoA thioesterase